MYSITYPFLSLVDCEKSQIKVSAENAMNYNCMLKHVKMLI